MDWDTPQWNTPKPGAARFEEGTPNVLGLAAMWAAMQLLEAVGTDAVEAWVLSLAAHTRTVLAGRGMTLVSPRGGQARTGIVAFRHPVLPNDSVEKTLTAAGVVCAVRCGNIRFASHVYSTESEIDAAVSAIPAP